MALSENSQLHKNFNVIKTIGKGGFGWVVKALHKTDSQHYAIKIVKVEENIEVSNEISTLIKLEHRNVVKYCNSWHEHCENYESSSSMESNTTASSNTDVSLKKIICIQMELCECTLKNVMESPLTDYKVFHFFNQICEGLKHIHEKGILHRDLKPENIFIMNGQCVKIGDFGLSRHCTLASDSIIADASGSLTPYIGTELYRAPEVEKLHYKYNQKADIYSLGIIYFEMCYGPFKTNMERYKLIKGIRQKILEMPEEFNKRCNNLIKELLDHNPYRRPTANVIILNKMPPSPNSLKKFMQTIDTKYVSKQRAAIYLRLFTRQESTEEGSGQFLNASESRLLQDYIAKLTNMFNITGVQLLKLPLFLQKKLMYFNVATNLCLLNDQSANVYAIPSDRRLCFIHYLKNSRFNAEKVSIRRYCIDTIYEGNKFGNYDEIIECNYDEAIHGGVVIGLLKTQIMGALNLLNYPSHEIHINHKLLYNDIINFLKISYTDQTILEEALLRKNVNEKLLTTNLKHKSKMSQRKIELICNIFSCKEQINLLQLNEFKESAGIIRKLIMQLHTNRVTCPIRIMPLMVPHYFSDGFVYEIRNKSNETLVKGSEYRVGQYYGAGFSLNISHACLVEEPLREFNFLPS